MAMLKILQYPDPRLKTKAIPVKDVNDPTTQKMIDDIVETLHNTPDCAGLAASQLDIKTPQHITVYDLSPDGSDLQILINPEIIEANGETLEPEGCMSIYPNDIQCPVKRAENITVKALDRQGKALTIESNGEFLGRCLQHEIDHLNGILFLDHLSPLKRKMVEKKIAKVLHHLGLA